MLLTGGASFTTTNTSTIEGGRGGDGGNGILSLGTSAKFLQGHAGSGGDGGIGVALTGGGSVTNSGRITAGAGGSPGSPDRYTYADRIASRGGTAVLVTAGGAVLNTGVLEGGQGGVGVPGLDGQLSSGIPPGAGGAGVVATGNTSVTNAGIITGGWSGDGITRANAIDFSGGNNTLTLESGYSFAGHVVSTSGSTNGGDTLRLGGDTNPPAAFNVSNIVAILPASPSGTQYVGFANFAKDGASTWQLTGNGSPAQNWSITGGTLRGDANTFKGDILFAPAAGGSAPGVVFDQGSGNPNSAASAEYAGLISGAGSVTLSVSADQNLGAGGSVLIDGGTLRTTSPFTTARLINLGLAGSILQTDADLTAAGQIGGKRGAALIKTGTGTLTLSGNNTYTGGTRLDAGVVSVSSNANLGNASGGLVFNGGTLQTTADVPMNRPTTLEAPGGTIDTLAGTTLSQQGAIGGPGDLTKTGGGTLSLAGANTYAGGTTISAGTLAGRAGSFGSGAIVNNAALRIDQAADATLANTITGSGTLTKTGAGVLTLAGVNTYEGGTTINAGTVAGRAASFGSGGITNNAALLIDQSSDATLANTLAGSGALTKTGTGTLTLTGENSYSGGTDLKQGGIAVGNNRALGTLTGAITGPGDLSKIGSGTLILSGANSYSGATAVTEGTLRAGAANTLSAASSHSVNPGATLDLAGFSQSIAALANAGTVSLIGSTPGTTLTVTGPYAGNNGLLRLGSFLGDSASASDRLILSGPAAVASGRTTVQVVNLGGLGALTTGNGIELVSALNGATTTAQSTKDAFALQGGHVDAGAFEYRLQPGDAAGAGENWYLRSTSTLIPPPPFPPPPPPPAPPAPPTAAELPAPAGPPSLPRAPSAAPIQVPTYRAEVPLFAALPEQLRQGNLAMLGNLHQRIGDDDVKTAAAGAQGSAAAPAGERRAWGRVLSTGRTLQQGGTVSPHSEGRLSGLQAGTDLWTNAHWRAGLYVGQLDGDMQVKGFARGIANFGVGSNDLRSQYLGGYATYTDTSGFYVDTVLQAGRHRYEVKPQASLRTKGKASSLSASLELGQSFALGEGWQIQPQAQLVHQRLDVDDVDIAGARVRQDRDSTWLARVGVRVKGDIATSAGRLQPYARVNLYRASGGNDVARFVNPAASTAIASSKGSTSTELATGFTLGLSESTSLYGEVGKLWASGGDTRVKGSMSGSVGVKVRW